jgi:hypothetical protein
MAQLIIEVDDEIAKEYGLASLKSDFENMINYDHLSKIAQKIENAVAEAGLDHDQIWKEAKSKAFAKFKEQHLKNIIP